MDGLTIIVPVYNEEKSIRSSVQELTGVAETIRKDGIQTEIIFVNDGSTDQSRDMLEETCKDTGCIVIHHALNRGYGAALKTGVHNSKHDTLCIVDADGTYPFGKIPQLLEQHYRDGNDMVVGARVNKDVNISWIRRPAKWFLTVLASFLSGVKIPDLNSGLRIMRKTVVEKYLRLLPNGFSFTSTITLAMLTNAYNVSYVPIDYYKRKGNSKIKPIQDTLNFIQLILRMVLYFDPLKIFLPIGVPMILFGFLYILYQVIVFRDIGTVSVIISLAGIELLAIGMIADLIDKRVD